MTPLGPYEEVKNRVNKRQASEMIRHLIDHVEKPVAPRQVKTGGLSLFSVPQGHYAVACKTGNNDLDFFSVDKPDQGRWKGYTFVKRIIGGRPSVPVRGITAQRALQDITDMGVEKSALLCAQSLGQCSACYRHLTKKASRTLGYGPDCAEERGLGAEWRRLDAEFGGE